MPSTPSYFFTRSFNALLLNDLYILALSNKQLTAVSPVVMYLNQVIHVALLRVLVAQGVKHPPESGAQRSGLKSRQYQDHCFDKCLAATTSCKNSGDTSPSWSAINLPIISHTAAPTPPLPPYQCC